MATSRARLRLLPDVDDDVVVSRVALRTAVDNMDALADDLEAGIDAVLGRVFAGSRPAAINELNRLGLRVQQLREDWQPLGGRTTPTRPLRLA